MSSQESSGDVSGTGAVAAPAGGKAGQRVVRLVALVSVMAFLAWFGVRIKEALATKAEQADERQKAHAAATAAANNKTEGSEIQSVSGRPTEWKPAVQIDGTVLPIEEAELTFKLPGRVQSVRVKVGQRVNRGETLATLESAEAEAQLEAARAQVRSMEAQLAMVKDSSARVTTLVQKGAGSEAMGIEAGARHDLTVAQLDAARAQLKLAEASVRNHVLSAPFPGTVTRVPSGPGAVINPGMPGAALFHLADTRRLRLTGSVNEAEVSLIKVGSEVRVENAGRKYAGKITAVLGSVDPVTRRVPVEAELDNDGKNGDAVLFAGSYVRATLLGATPESVLSLPASTLRPGTQDEVMLIESGKLRSRRIQFVHADGGTLLVRAGLLPTDKVWLNPTNEARDGDVVVASNK